MLNRKDWHRWASSPNGRIFPGISSASMTTTFGGGSATEGRGREQMWGRKCLNKSRTSKLAPTYFCSPDSGMLLGPSPISPPSTRILSASGVEQASTTSARPPLKRKFSHATSVFAFKKCNHQTQENPFKIRNLPQKFNTQTHNSPKKANQIHRIQFNNKAIRNSTYKKDKEFKIYKHSSIKIISTS